MLPSTPAGAWGVALEIRPAVLQADSLQAWSDRKDMKISQKQRKYGCSNIKRYQKYGLKTIKHRNLSMKHSGFAINYIYIYMWYIYIWYIYIYDMIWYDMIWYDMIWYDMLCYDMIWYDTYIHIYIYMSRSLSLSLTIAVCRLSPHSKTTPMHKHHDSNWMVWMSWNKMRIYQTYSMNDAHLKWYAPT